MLAGLMALGHGTEIVRELRTAAGARLLGVVLLTFANATGGLIVAAFALVVLAIDQANV